MKLNNWDPFDSTCVPLKRYGLFSPVVLSAASAKSKDPLTVDVQSIHNKQKHNCLQSLDCCHSVRSRGIPQAEMCNNKKEYTNNKKNFQKQFSFLKFNHEKKHIKWYAFLFYIPTILSAYSDQLVFCLYCWTKLFGTYIC